MTDRAIVAKDFFGVQHMDKLDNSRAIVVRDRRQVAKAERIWRCRDLCGASRERERPEENALRSLTLPARRL